jgi:2'-5' RNA ligase
MDDFSDSVMIALLPITTDWCRIECPHLTLVYAGEVKDLKPTAFNELAKDAASLAMLSTPIMLKVTGVEVFGDEDKVNVLRLLPSSELWAMRRVVEHWNKSEYPFRPHATIGPANQFEANVPGYLAFDRIMVGWGEDKLTFWLRK